AEMRRVLAALGLLPDVLVCICADYVEICLARRANETRASDWDKVKMELVGFSEGEAELLVNKRLVGDVEPRPCDLWKSSVVQHVDRCFPPGDTWADTRALIDTFFWLPTRRALA